MFVIGQEDEEDVLKELDDLMDSEENISELPEVPTNGKYFFPNSMEKLVSTV